MGTGGNNVPIVINIKEIVRVRKYEVNIEWLKEILRDHRKISIKELSEKLNKPKTLVEHWFRKDNSFAIPSEDIWMELKKILWIKTDEFDQSIMEWEIREWVYDTENRVYHIEGKAPTLNTVTLPKITDGYYWRKLIVRECARAQSFPESYSFDSISASRAYKAIGNSWEGKAIRHIWEYLFTYL